MMISTRGRYVLRVLMNLAEHNDGEYISRKDTADLMRTETSHDYVI